MSNADWDRIGDALDGTLGAEQQRLAEQVTAWGALLLRKNADYGSAVYQAPVFAPHLSPGEAILVRMSDKVARLGSLLKGGKAPEVSESFDDTLRDLGSYALLYLARPTNTPG